MSVHGLFPALLGTAFPQLAPAVRQVHCGQSLELEGRADVVRGTSFIARTLCTVARLARDQRDAPVRVVIDAHGEREVWTRYFGTSPIMRSMLSANRGALRERFGPAALEFALRAQEGAVIWRPVRARLFGLPVPPRWLAAIEAGACEEGGRYAFRVNVALPGVGLIIGYRGLLERPRSRSLAAP